MRHQKLVITGIEINSNSENSGRLIRLWLSETIKSRSIQKPEARDWSIDLIVGLHPETMKLR